MNIVDLGNDPDFTYEYKFSTRSNLRVDEVANDLSESNPVLMISVDGENHPHRFLISRNLANKINDVYGGMRDFICQFDIDAAVSNNIHGGHILLSLLNGTPTSNVIEALRTAHTAPWPAGRKKTTVTVKGIRLKAFKTPPEQFAQKKSQDADKLPMTPNASGVFKDHPKKADGLSLESCNYGRIVEVIETGEVGFVCGLAKNESNDVMVLVGASYLGDLRYYHPRELKEVTR